MEREVFLTSFSTAEIALGNELAGQLDTADIHEQRNFDSYKIYNRKRNAHACIMSIVFIVLYPLGAISIHLPIDRIPYLKSTYLRNKVLAIHAPIQAIAFVMMVGGMALGIRIAHDLGYINHPVHAHIIIGLLVVSVIILLQPIMGILQHRYFKKTGGRSIFGIVHCWIGRGAIVLGMINSGLGFQLAERNTIVPNRSYIRNYVLLGVLVSVWISVIILDKFIWQRPTRVVDGGEAGASDKKAASNENR